MIEPFIQRYAQRLSSLIEEAQQCGEIRNTITKKVAVHQFIAAIQHLVFRMPIVGMSAACAAQLHAFESYRVSIEANK